MCVRALLICLLLTAVQNFSHHSFSLTDSSQGAPSHYLFTFAPSLSLSHSQIVITFPIEYSVSSFASSLQCYSLLGGLHDEFEPLACWVEPDSTPNS